MVSIFFSKTQESHSEREALREWGPLGKGLENGRQEGQKVLPEKVSIRVTF